MSARVRARAVCYFKAQVAERVREGQAVPTPGAVGVVCTVGGLHPHAQLEPCCDDRRSICVLGKQAMNREVGRLRSTFPCFPESKGQ